MRLIWLGSAWLVGVALGPRASAWWPPALCIVLALLALAALYPLWRRLLLTAALLLVVLALGTWRGSAARTPPADLPRGEIEAVRGRVTDWPEGRGHGNRATVLVDEVRIAGRWQGALARVWAETPLYPPLGRGDRVELFGHYRPAETITLAGYRDALRRRGLHGQFRAFGTRVMEADPRDDVGARRVAGVTWIEETLRRQIAQPEAALVVGVLLGNAQLLPPGQRDAFHATGTSHIMALSGWNIALVAGFCALVGQRLGRHRSWWWIGGSIAVLWFYAGLVGGGATIVRAAIMGTLYLIASLTGRQGDTLTALVVAATLMTAVTPAVLLDIGFQLSCVATLGLILCAGRLAGALGRLPPLLAEGIAATVAAELFTLPLVLRYFGQLSIVTLPANVLIEPLVPLVMAGGVATVAASAAGDGLGALVGLAAWLPARLLLLIVERFGALEWATIAVAPPPLPVIGLLYAALGAASSGPAWVPALLAAGRRALAEARSWPALAPLLYGVLSGLAAGAWGAVLLGW